MKNIKFAGIIAFFCLCAYFGHLKAAQNDYWTGGYLNSYDIWRINSSGALIPGITATYDIGSSSFKPSTIYTGTLSATTVSATTLSGAVSGTTGSFSSTVSAGTTTIAGALYIGGADGVIDSTVTQAGALTAASVTSVGAATVGTNLTVTAGFLQVYSRSEAQLVLITPTAVGQVYYCSDCAVSKGLVVSTGTNAGNFAAADGSAFN